MTTKRTAAEWWDYFVSNEPAEFSAFSPIVRNNMRMKAWNDFRAIKIAKGEWIGPGADEVDQ